VTDSGFFSGSEKPKINRRPELGGKGTVSVVSSWVGLNSATETSSGYFISFGTTTTLMELGGATDR